MKKNIGLLALTLLTLGISACNSSKNVDFDNPEKDFCVKLKRQMLYNSTNNNTEASYLTVEQKQQLQNSFTAHHCDQYL